VRDCHDLSLPIRHRICAVQKSIYSTLTVAVTAQFGMRRWSEIAELLVRPGCKWLPTEATSARKPINLWRRVWLIAEGREEPNKKPFDSSACGNYETSLGSMVQAEFFPKHSNDRIRSPFAFRHSKIRAHAHRTSPTICLFHFEPSLGAKSAGSYI